MSADDLAHIHDRGFSHHARGTAAGILDTLTDAGVDSGLVVELGCGGGITARALTQVGLQVVGVDQSVELILRARRRAPAANFEIASFYDFEIPDCAAVVSIGECLGYRNGKKSGTTAMMGLLRDAHAALPRNGILLFDLVTPEVDRTALFFRKGEDWVLASNNTRDEAGKWLRREITTFVKQGTGYRRGEETHWVQLYDPTDMAKRLRDIGFAVRVRRNLGDYTMPPGRAVFIARKR